MVGESLKKFLVHESIKFEKFKNIDIAKVFNSFVK